RPPQATARYLAEAQMNTFHLHPEYEDFTEWTGGGQPLQPGRIQLEGQHRARCPFRVFLEIVGSQRCLDRIEVASQDLVLIKAWDGGQSGLNRLAAIGYS